MVRSSLVFFAFDSIFRGYLIFKSGFFPWALGILVILSGISYLTNSIVLFLDMPSSPFTFAIFAVTAALPELMLSLWLIIKGVDVSKWEQA